MKIPQKLPQFLTSNSLIITTGRLIANFYIAHNGSMLQISSVEEERPKFSDHEGFFMSSGPTGGVTKAGAVYELDDNDIKNHFFKKFNKEIDFLYHERKFDDIYLFSPSHMITEVFNNLPAKMQDKVRMKIKGNHVKDHPTKLLKVIDKEIDKKIQAEREDFTSPEEMRIIEKAETARTVIRS